VFRPTGFAFKGTPAALAQMQAMGRLLEPVGASAVVRDAGEGSADLMALGQAGVPIMELTVDGSRYFWFHHTEADTVDKLDRGEFNRCVAALAAMAYVAAESPGRLPR
jgi:carboxypeptidase Q